jgi:hypothetical protein
MRCPRNGGASCRTRRVASTGDCGRRRGRLPGGIVGRRRHAGASPRPCSLLRGQSGPDRDPGVGRQSPLSRHRGRLPGCGADAARHDRPVGRADDGARHASVAASRLPRVPSISMVLFGSRGTVFTRLASGRFTQASSSQATSASRSLAKRSCGSRSGSATRTRASSCASLRCRPPKVTVWQRAYPAIPRSRSPGPIARQSRRLPAASSRSAPHHFAPSTSR